MIVNTSSVIILEIERNHVTPVDIFSQPVMDYETMLRNKTMLRTTVKVAKQ